VSGGNTEALHCVLFLASKHGSRIPGSQGAGSPCAATMPSIGWACVCVSPVNSHNSFFIATPCSVIVAGIVTITLQGVAMKTDIESLKKDIQSVKKEVLNQVLHGQAC